MNADVNVREIIRLDVTESTNSIALELGNKGAAPGTVVVANSQTGGRGRLNRSWLSLPGMGLYFSIILRPRLAPENLPKGTLAAGLALCKAVEAAYSLCPQIKWPNDLLLGGRKFGGILTETESIAGSDSTYPLVIVGVGLNLSSPEEGFPADIEERATAISLHTDMEISPEMLLETCVTAVEKEVGRLEKGDFPLILEEWLQRDAIQGKVLTWVTPGSKLVTGVSLGPDADGVLRIRDRAGTIHTVLSGDVNLAGKIPE
ncbi:MAG: biotin--[acetyl-CoA-carboxylase] ligase [Desulfobulbaceae bacterium]|nr:biotin--[acetyl-CoA-carboxylase] ligase [Desulfobulbaceae bacterium]